MTKIFYFSFSKDFYVFPGYVSKNHIVCDHLLQDIDMKCLGIRHIYESPNSEFYTFEESDSGYVYYFHKSKLEDFIKNALTLQEIYKG